MFRRIRERYASRSTIPATGRLTTMLFIEALAQTMVVLVGVGAAVAYGLSKLESLVSTVQAADAKVESRSLDDDLRDL